MIFDNEKYNHTEVPVVKNLPNKKNKNKIDENYFQKLTIVVYKVQTSPVANTAPHSSNPVTERKHINTIYQIYSKSQGQRKMWKLSITCI